MKLTETLRNADRIGLIGSCTAREVKELACGAASRRPCGLIPTRPILRPFWPVIRWC